MYYQFRIVEILGGMSGIPYSRQGRQNNYRLDRRDIHDETWKSSPEWVAPSNRNLYASPYLWSEIFRDAERAAAEMGWNLNSPDAAMAEWMSDATHLPSIEGSRGYDADAIGGFAPMD